MPLPAYPTVGASVRRLLAFCVCLLGVLAVSAQTLTLTQIRNTGPRDRRMNIVFVAEAFTAAEEAEFNRQVDSITAAFVADEGFGRFADHINVFRLFVPSNQAGPDETDRGIYHDTYFNSYLNSGLIGVDDGTVARFQSVLAEQIPDFDLAIMLINMESAVGPLNGLGRVNGGIAWVTTRPADIDLIGRMTLHEAGHAFAGLRDEYITSTPAGGTTPVIDAPNVSSQSARDRVAWSRFIFPSTPTPTTDSWYGYTGADAVGTFPGALNRVDLFRSTNYSRMYDVDRPWGPVNLRALATAMHRLNLEQATTPPTITRQPSSGQIILGQSVTLAVEATGTGPITYQWMRDGVYVPGGHLATFTIAAMSKQDAGAYSVEVTNAAGTTTSTPVTITTADGPGGHWDAQDIGAVGMTGQTIDAGSTKTVRGSGADIGGTADAFQYAYKTLTGDGTIVARWTGLWLSTRVVDLAKAGVMFRESLQPNAREAALLYQWTAGGTFHYRATTGGATSTSASVDPGAAWLRITRSGDTFTGYVGRDGGTWQFVGSTTLPGMPATLYVGVASTSHDTTQILSAEFHQVAVTSATATVPAAPTGLSASVTGTNQVTLTWTDASTNETGFEVERAIGGATGQGPYSRIATLGANTTSYVDTNVAASTQYYYRVRATGSAGASAYSNEATVMTPVTPPPSGTWIGGDIGAVAASGSSTENSISVTVRGSGADIWEGADEFYYRYRSWSGDGEFVARVAISTNTNPWAKAGLMVRESIAANSRHAFMNVSAGHGTSLQSRATTGGQTVSTPSSESGGTVQWVKLVRSGNTLTGYASLDGTTWTLAGSVTLTLPTDVLVGLAVTSHNDGVLCEAQFGSITLTGGGAPPPPPPPPPPAPPPAPASLSATPNTSSRIDLHWTDNSTNETGFEVERSLDNASFTRLTTLSADVTAYSDTGLTADTTYYYRVRAVNAAGNSAYSNTASARTAATPPPPPPLSSPTFLTANLASDTQINLKWTDNSSDEDGFEIFRATDGANFVSVGTVSANITTFANTGLAAATTYTYRVRATRGTEQSSFSNQAYAITPTPSFPRPTNLVASALDSSHIRLTWTDNSSDEDGFEVERSTDGVVFSGTVSTGPNVTTIDSFGLDAATTYTFRVRAIRGAARSSYTNLASATTAAVYVPGPVNLTATAVSSTRVDLNWTDSSTLEDGFRIERAFGSSGSFAEIGTVGANVTTFTDTGVAGSTYYRYRVRATAGGSFSAYSETSVITPAAPAPAPVAAPSALSASAPFATRIDLTWTDNSNDEDGFEIERSTDGITFAVVGTTAANVTTFRSEGLSPSTAYTYRVRATRGTDRSTYSNLASATTTAQPPSPPANLTATAISSTRIDLTWTDTDTSEDGFRIERSIGADSLVEIATVGPNITTYSDTTVRPGNTYYYRVRAIHGSGNTEYSNGASATTPGVPPLPNTWSRADIGAVGVAGSDDMTASPAVVRGSGGDIWEGADAFHFVYQSLRGDGSIVARVTGVSNTNGWAKAGVMIRESLAAGARNTFVLISAGNGMAAQNRATTGGATTSTPNGVWGQTAPQWVRLTRTGSTVTTEWSSNGTTWNPIAGFSIAYGADALVGLAVTSHNNGALCTATFTDVSVAGSAPPPPPPPAPPAAPTSLTATATSTSAIALAWTDASTNETGFEVERSADNITFTARTTTAAGAASFADSGLSASTTYYYRVRAVNAAGASAYSNVASAQTNAAPPPPTPPAAPTGLSATASSSSAIALAWTDASTNETGFEVERSTDNVSFANRSTTAAGVTTLTDSGLTAATTYYYRVRAVNAAGASAYTATASARTNDAPPPPTPPAAPTGLSATASSSSAIALAWTDASTNETGFEVERSTDNVSFANRATTAAGVTTFADTGLTASTTYYYRVRAVNAAGASAYSNTASAQTNAAPPPPAVTWDSRDIGGVARAGSVTAIDGGIALSGSGEDIWNNADEFRYYYQPMTGDGEIIARVTGLTNTNGWAKAGVMFRQSLDANSAHALMCVSIDHGTAFQYRAATGGDSASSNPSEVAGAIRWVRLVRTGNTIASYESENGTTWTPVMSRTFNFPATIYAGLAVTSHNDGTNTTATFTNISLTGGSTPPPAPPPPPTTVNAPSGLSATAASSTQINLTWTDNATNETGFEIERAVGSGSFGALATVGADRTGYSDTTVTAGTSYSYRVRAVAGTVTSSYSNVASATPTAAPPPPPATTWSFGDIGGVGVSGSNTSDSNSITVRGSGSDIWERADGFRFVYRALTGDGTVEAQVTSLQNTNGWAKAGVMIRESLAANSANAAAFVTPDHGVVAQTRAATNAETSSIAGPGRTAPYWLRLTRSGSTFTAASSADGVSWTTFATFTIPMNATAYFGFAVTSHDNSQLNTAAFADPSVH